MTPIMLTIKFEGEQDDVLMPVAQVPHVGEYMQFPHLAEVYDCDYRVDKVIWVGMYRATIEVSA